MDVRAFTVGPMAENCYLLRANREAREALLVDPGDEASRLLAAIDALGVEIVAILLTHTHFDHVGAVAPLARATGAPVHCPEAEAFVLADLERYTWPGYGPYESYDAEHVVNGGDRLSLAGLELDVLFTPGHSLGHVSYHAAEPGVLASGDVLFQGSIGRTDLPGGDHATLLATLAELLAALPDETRVLPGHMGQTTLGRERATNPFLRELATR